MMMEMMEIATAVINEDLMMFLPWENEYRGRAFIAAPRLDRWEIEYR